MDEERYLTPDEERSKTRKRVAFFLIIVGGAVLYFVWANFLNFGKVSLYGDAPFKAEIFGGEIFLCNDSPCELKAKTGTYSIIISKENFQQNLVEATFKLWQKTPITITFKVNPYIEKTNVIPEKEKEISYTIILDNETKMYKLINAEDKSKTALAYFPKKIKNPIIFGSKYTVIVSEGGQIQRETSAENTTLSQQKAYLINLSTKTKTPLPDFDYSKITEYKFSADGTFFQFKKSDSNYWWIMDLSAKNISSPKQTIIESNLKTDWTYGDKMVYVSQNFGLNLYDPEKEKYSNLGVFAEMKEYPLDIIAASNGGVVYIETKAQKFKIVLQ